MAEALMSSRHTHDPRNSNRQRLVQHLVRCGERCVLEGLVAIENGQSVDDMLEDFGRVPAATFHRVGASKLPIPHELTLKRRKP
jgi:hypothetical protein